MNRFLAHAVLFIGLSLGALAGTMADVRKQLAADLDEPRSLTEPNSVQYPASLQRVKGFRSALSQLESTAWSSFPQKNGGMMKGTTLRRLLRGVADPASAFHNAVLMYFGRSGDANSALEEALSRAEQSAMRLSENSERNKFLGAMRDGKKMTAQMRSAGSVTSQEWIANARNILAAAG